MFQKLDELGKTLVIGRRTNVRYKNKPLYHPSDVTKLAKQKGRLFVVSAIDYFFIARNAFPWHRIPDMVIGRNGYDNFLVLTAIENNVSVIDATGTLLAVHQTDEEGNFAGTKNTVKKRINLKLLHKITKTRVRKYILPRGYTDPAPYETIYANNNSDGAITVMFIRRPQLPVQNSKRKKIGKVEAVSIAEPLQNGQHAQNP